MLIRDFTENDAAAVNSVALAAFAQYRNSYADWPAFSRNIGVMTTLAAQGELIVAEADGRIAGAVAYIGPHRPKAAFFDPAWPIIRMLVVDPTARGAGIGRALTSDCIRRAERDRAAAIALHTSPIMEVALAMYLRLGFTLVKPAPPIHGVPYGVYLKHLRAEADAEVGASASKGVR
jgi:ribosomal protein S18 acetylase RimI-like enzyme